eukprot:gene13561-13687_t
MKGYDHMAYNIALCGEARVGKSSLCNALLGLRDFDRVTRDTILEVDAHIIKQAQLAGQRVAIVRTHAEPQIKGLMRSRGLSAEAAAYTLKRSMFDNMVEELRRYGASPDVDIFFVDRWAFCEENFYQESGIRLGSSDGLLDEPKLLMWLAGLERERSK